MRPHARDVAQSGQQMFRNTLNVAENRPQVARRGSLAPRHREAVE
jgi:hypothetical protein